MPQVAVVLPWQLVRLTGRSERTLAVEVPAPDPANRHDVTLNDVIEALGRLNPALDVALREPVPQAPSAGGPRWRLRPYIRAFAGATDLTPAGLEARLPDECLMGGEPVRFVGAIAGGRLSPAGPRADRGGVIRQEIVSRGE